MAIIVALCEPQRLNTLALSERVGVGVTETVDELTDEQLLSVPVTVYIVVEVGLITILAVVAVVFHKYAVAPLAVNVAELPAQTVAELTLTVGVVFTVTVVVFKSEQFPLVPVIVYAVVEEGDGLITAVLAPVFHE